jgi:hypothetical protein
MIFGAICNSMECYKIVCDILYCLYVYFDIHTAIYKTQYTAHNPI